MTLPESLEQFGEKSVLGALACFDEIGVHDFAGQDAQLAEELVRCALVRGTVLSRFLMTDGEVRLRIQSHGLSVAGGWMKRILTEGAERA